VLEDKRCWTAIQKFIGEDKTLSPESCANSREYQHNNNKKSGNFNHNLREFTGSRGEIIRVKFNPITY
jgi:hypothetical protein